MDGYEIAKIRNKIYTYRNCIRDSTVSKNEKVKNTKETEQSAIIHILRYKTFFPQWRRASRPRKVNRSKSPTQESGSEDRFPDEGGDRPAIRTPTSLSPWNRDAP